jgi:hypothetical protein
VTSRPEGGTTYPTSHPHTPTPPPAPSVPNGPLARLLRHPGATERHWQHQLLHTLAAHQTHAEIAAGAMMAAVVVAVLVRRGARVAALRHGHWLRIDPPTQPSADGGAAFWRQLAPLLSSQRTLAGTRPPVTVEWIADSGRLHVGLWCSATIGHGAIREAVQTAWPGAHLTATAPPTLLPGRSGGPRMRVSCARVRLALPHWYPFGGNESAAAGRADLLSSDPLRGLLTALAAPPAGGRAVLQVMVQPASRRTLRGARRAVITARTGAPTRTGSLSWLSPGTTRRTSPTQADPIALADARAITAKLTDAPLFQAEVRIAVTTPGGRAGRRARAAWLRHTASALGLYSGRQRLLLAPARRSRAAMNRRQPGHGFLTSLHEIAALAHLPAEPSRYGMNLAAARAVAAPADLTDA